MWDPPRPELEPVSPALAGRFSTTAPPGKRQVHRVLTSSCRVPFTVWVCLCFWHAHHHQNYLPKALSSRTSMVPHYLQFKNLEQINGFLMPPFLVIHQQQCLLTVLSQGAFWTPKIKIKKKKKSESWVMCTCFRGSVQKQTNLKIPLLVDTLIGKKEELE